eukprot:s1005_g43.t1
MREGMLVRILFNPVGGGKRGLGRVSESFLIKSRLQPTHFLCATFISSSSYADGVEMYIGCFLSASAVPGATHCRRMFGE